MSQSSLPEALDPCFEIQACRVEGLGFRVSGLRFKPIGLWDNGFEFAIYWLRRRVAAAVSMCCLGMYDSTCITGRTCTFCRVAGERRQGTAETCLTDRNESATPELSN